MGVPQMMQWVSDSWKSVVYSFSLRVSFMVTEMDSSLILLLVETTFAFQSLFPV